MNTRILSLMAAAICLFSCSKHEIVTPTPEPEASDEYRIEILGADGTKSTVTTVNLNLADLTMTSSKTVTAQLKKKSGTSWVSVTSGVTYSWSATSTDSQKFSGSGTTGQACTVSAKAEGSGAITVSANLSGATVATLGVPVVVSDNREISWSNASTTITSNVVKTATLNCNFSGTVSISSDNSNFLVGTSSATLASSASVAFSSGTTNTIYYEYTGSGEPTVKVSAASGSISGNLNVTVEASTLKPKSLAVVTSSTLIPYTGSSSDAVAIAKGKSFYFKVTYEDNSVKQIKASDNLSFNCRYPYATVMELSSNPGYFYLHTFRAGSQSTISTATAYITASYTENGTTVSVDMYLTVYNWILTLGQSGSDMIVTYGDGATKTLGNTAFYYIGSGGSHISGWPRSVSVANIVYLEKEQSIAAGNYYTVDGTYGVPCGKFSGSFSSSILVEISEVISN